MKHILTAFLLLLSLNSHALIRKSSTPQLKSPITNSSTPAPSAFSGLGYADFATMPALPPGFRHSYTSAETWRKRGIGFTIAGGSAALLGTAAWLSADAQSAKPTPSGGRSDNLLQYILAGLLMVAGLVFLAIGLPIWLTHLN